MDDNFIGNKRNAKLLLPQIRTWQEERQYPFSFATEASVDLADDEEMMRMMHDARFESVFLGIETPDEASLETARKVQNTRNPLDAAVDRITANGIRVMAGFIIGFDGEKDGAGRRIVDFVTRTGIPAAMMGMLQALPKTALWARLEREGRLIQGEDAAKGVNQTNLLNFEPTRPIRDIANEYVEAFCALYEPNAYMDRVYSYYLKMGAPRWKTAAKLPTWIDIKALSTVVWRQGDQTGYPQPLLEVHVWHGPPQPRPAGTVLGGLSPQRALPRIPLDRSAGNPRTTGIAATGRAHSPAKELQPA